MNYIVFDLEATCGKEIPDGESEIIEIGAVKLNDKLEVVDEFQSFIRPVLHPQITYFCEDLTSITQADVDGAPVFEDVYLDFIRWCKEVAPFSQYTDDFWLCSWGYYDKKMLKTDCNRWGVPHNEFTNHISVKHQHGSMIGIKRGVGMTSALEKLGIALEGTHHRGIDDARNIAKIFVNIFPNLKFDTK
ncbi:3'-5' exonuclease [Paenibacillus illinoisensis]|uniref:3'-5' exonuclease n=1 Tax=Paenibacillus illinoisensis TaxID=59845 RepID=UPI003019A1B0